MKSKTRRGAWEFFKAAVAAKITLAPLGRNIFFARRKNFLAICSAWF
jgi:hypothetical protein